VMFDTDQAESEIVTATILGVDGQQLRA
jgi:threonylcarbamoyladenosine tRNA methylthiotransferase MtaB